MRIGSLVDILPVRRTSSRRDNGFSTAFRSRYQRSPRPQCRLQKHRLSLEQLGSPLRFVSLRESGEDRERLGSDESGTSFVVPLTRSLPRVLPFGRLLRRSLTRPPGLRVLQNALRNRAPSEATPSLATGEAARFHRSPRLRRNREMGRRCAQCLEVRSETGSSALPEHWTWKSQVLADRARRSILVLSRLDE